MTSLLLTLNSLTASDLNRKLLFHGYDDVTDFLKNSPLNRYLYKRILGILSAGRIEVPVATLFNEIYYQCVRVNYDSAPGSDLERRYWQEESERLRSPEGAQLVFCVVWGLLNVKRNITFHEECFLRGMASFIRDCSLHALAEELPGELLTYNLEVPERFPVMTCPIAEVDMLWKKAELLGDCHENTIKYRERLTAIKTRYHEAWREVTGRYSPTVMEKYVRLYADQEDQLKLLHDMKTGLTREEFSKCNPFFRDLELRIQTGSFGLSNHAVIPSEAGTAGDERAEVHFSLGDADDDSSLNLVKQYKQERDALKLQLEELEKSHAMELARMEAQHKAVTKELMKENGKLIRWPSKRRTGELKPATWNANVQMFSLDEMADYMKERFSKSGAEEVSAMLYHLAVKHGALGEETFRQIDSIVPAILKRTAPRQIFELPNVQQFNNRPGTVVNHAEHPLTESTTTETPLNFTINS